MPLRCAIRAQSLQPTRSTSSTLCVNTTLGNTHTLVPGIASEDSGEAFLHRALPFVDNVVVTP